MSVSKYVWLSCEYLIGVHQYLLYLHVFLDIFLNVDQLKNLYHPNFSLFPLTSTFLIFENEKCNAKHKNI